jgi:hypothetical protein
MEIRSGDEVEMKKLSPPYYFANILLEIYLEVGIVGIKVIN